MNGTAASLSYLKWKQDMQPSPLCSPWWQRLHSAHLQPKRTSPARTTGRSHRLLEWIPCPIPSNLSPIDFPARPGRMTWKFTSRANSIIESRRPPSSTAAMVIPRSDKGKDRKVGTHQATNKMDRNVYVYIYICVYMYMYMYICLYNYIFVCVCNVM